MYVRRLVAAVAAMAFAAWSCAAESSVAGLNMAASFLSIESSVWLITGIFLTIALFNTIFFFGFNRQPAFLLLALYSLIHVAKIGLVFSVYYSTQTDVAGYDLKIQLMHISAYLGSLFLVAFLLGNFAIPRLWQWMLLLLIPAAIAFWLEFRAGFILLALALAFALTGYALWKKREGAILSLVGLVGYGLFSYLGNLQLVDFGYFIGALFFIICMTLSFGRQIIRKNQRHQAATLRAARLENQLLKKNIQPHFIMNSLMSLQELLLKDPQKSGELIDALAEEFRLFSRASGDPLIAIEDELALCRAHLKIMSFRKNAGFTLETCGIEGNERVPPAIFHTLVENGITHGYANRKQGHFILTKERIDAGTRYTLFNDGESCDDPREHGTGLKYVAARLEESYPGAWNLQSRAAVNGWEVCIEIEHTHRRERESG